MPPTSISQSGGHRIYSSSVPCPPLLYLSPGPLQLPRAEGSQWVCPLPVTVIPTSTLSLSIRWVPLSLSWRQQQSLWPVAQIPEPLASLPLSLHPGSPVPPQS